MTPIRCRSCSPPAPSRRRRSRRRAATPTSASTRGIPGDGTPPVPYLRRVSCPRPERFALLYEVRVVEGDRRDLLAARHLGDAELWWRLARRERRRRPARAHRAGRPAAAHHAAARASRGAPMADAPVVACSCSSAPACRSRRRAACSTRCRRSRSSRTRARRRAASSSRSRSRTARRCRRCSCSPAASRIPILRVVIAVTFGGATTVLMDGVMTQPRAALRRRPDVDARRQGQGPDGADGPHRRSTGFPYPAMPPAVRVLVAVAKYAALGVIPLVIPSVHRGRPDPDRPDPAPPGHRLRLRHGARARGRLRLLHRSRAGAGHEQGVLGPGDPRRRAAARAQRRRWTARTTTCRALCASPSTRSGRSCRSSSSRSRREGADPDPDPGHHAAQPAARRRPAAAAEDQVPQRHREARTRSPRRCAGSRTPGSTRDAVFGTGSLDVVALRPRAAGRGSSSACAARARRSTASTT